MWRTTHTHTRTQAQMCTHTHARRCAHTRTHADVQLQRSHHSTVTDVLFYPIMSSFRDLKNASGRDSKIVRDFASSDICVSLGLSQTFGKLRRGGGGGVR